MPEIFIISLRKTYKNSEKRTWELIKKIKYFNPKVIPFWEKSKYSDSIKINFVGINGVLLDNKKINQKYIDQKLSDTRRLGTLGCALSHALTLQLIKIKKFNTDILVFEEDAILNKNIFDVINFFPKDYDVIFLHPYHLENFYQQKEATKNAVFRKINKQINLDQPIGTIALAINGRNIENIIKNILPIKEPYDWHLAKPSNNLNKYIFNPHYEFLLNPPLEQSYRERIDVVYPILKKLF